MNHKICISCYNVTCIECSPTVVLLQACRILLQWQYGCSCLPAGRSSQDV